MFDGLVWCVGNRRRQIREHPEHLVVTLAIFGPLLVLRFIVLPLI
jgi:hypothetical protein